MSNHASAVDTETSGEYTITRAPDATRPVYRFDGHVSASASVADGWQLPIPSSTTVR